MEQLIQDVLRILNQPGTPEDLKDSIQDVIQNHKENRKFKGFVIKRVKQPRFILKEVYPNPE